MKLYEIDATIERLLDMGDGRMVDEETGEIFDQEELEALEMEREKKVDQCCFFVKNCLADAKSIDEEIKRLTAKKKALENKANRTKDYLNWCLQGEKFKSTFNTIGYHKSVKVEVDEAKLAEMDSRFLNIKTEPNKTEIKKALQSGEEINGAMLVETMSLTLK